MQFIQDFLSETKSIIDQLDLGQIDLTIHLLSRLQQSGGRLFILGVGGSAANAAHAVNDFRKILNIEAYAPTDNVAELTARTNDEGWATTLVNWLRVSRLKATDGILVLSVGGGDAAKNISPNLVAALQYAKAQGSTIMGIVSRDGGYTKQVADACIMIPVLHAAHITPQAEAFQAILWHLFVSHPRLQALAKPKTAAATEVAMA